MRVTTIAAVLIPALVLCGTGCATKKKSAAATSGTEVVNAEAILAQVDVAMAQHKLRKAKTILQKIRPSGRRTSLWSDWPWRMRPTTWAMTSR